MLGVKLSATGLIGVHKYEDCTGIFTVVPTADIELEEGFYPAHFVKSVYTNMNLGINLLEGGHASYEKYNKLLEEQGIDMKLRGMGIAGLMTSPIWGFKKRNKI